jgi:hypothetical protein
MGCSSGTENPDVGIALTQIPVANFRYNPFGRIRQPWELVLEQQKTNMWDKMIADERVGFLVPVLPQDAKIHMDQEL